MELLPFGALPPYRPRRFVPKEVIIGDWAQVAPLFDQLETCAADCKTPSQLEQWLLDWSELSSALDEEASRRYIAMTCHTDNPEAERAYLDFIEKIEPNAKARQFKLARTYTGHPCRSGLPEQRYKVLDRDTRLQVELFRPENVPLETEDARLAQQYQKLVGSLTVQFRGQEKTLIQMLSHLEDPDRATRQEAWELTARRRLDERDRFDELYDQLIQLRSTIARNAGFANFRDYAFRKMGRFDYTPEDCQKFHEAVELEVMPVVRELHAERRQHLGAGTLRPWDLAVDPLGRAPLHPFENVEQLVSRTQSIFDRMDGELAGGFRQMQERKLLDLANRKGKGPGGYQQNLSESRLPFIFMNAVGIQRDVETMLHEAGHAFHFLAAQEEDLMPYRSAPTEFCEVASMSMELIGNEMLEPFCSPAESHRARRSHLESIIVYLFPWVATIDAFQHWVYTHPGHSRSERSAAWMELMDRFGGDVDWSGHELARANLWHRQLHLFGVPFYYIEYAIAQLGALQVWANSRRDRRKALNDYKSALRLGGSRPLPELFDAAGCRFAFDCKTLAPLVQAVREELDRLPVT